MTISLLAVKFNHDPTSATADALNIRRNARRIVEVPEWRRGSVNPEDSVAAYSARDTLGRTVTVQAKIISDEPIPAPIMVRAIEPLRFDPFAAFMQSQFNNPLAPFFLWYHENIARLAPSVVTNVLGELRAKLVTFGPDGQTDFESFVCDNHHLWTVGVGVHTVNWRWQFRLGDGPWIDFDNSRHRIYTLLDTPTMPWIQLPNNPLNTQLLWTDVLDFACRWAQGAVSADQAAIRITDAVNKLGPGLVKYDCPGGGGTHYTLFSPRVVFDCTGFLNLLHGDPTQSRLINCIDCATIVSTFSNAVGCDLSQSGMFSDAGLIFTTNEIRAIGSNIWRTPCGWPGFAYHEVAWKDPCTETENVFDACLLVDGDFDPTRPPHIPLLPANVRFGNSGDRDYRDRLCTVAGRPNCEPHPASTRRRRPVI
jgi:hypothetical protein